MIGREVGRYRIVEHRGSGAMGVVYRAEDTRLNRMVALKFLPQEWSRDPARRERLKKEARAASVLDHPAVCTIYEIDETADGQLFIAMAYYRGASLDRILEQGPMSIPVAIRVAAAVGDGLARAHSAGIVHRDIKPGNVMITDRGEVKILDFGLAKLAGQAGVTMTGTTVGTPAYMSPEQALGGEVDGRTDTWALGVMLFEMLGGERPFRGEHASAVLLAILQLDPEPIARFRPDAPAGVQAILDRAMAKDRDKRYATIEEMMADLAALGLAQVSGPGLRSTSEELRTLSCAAMSVPVTAASANPPRSSRGVARRAILIGLPLAGLGLAVPVAWRLLAPRRRSLVVRRFTQEEGLVPGVGRVASELLTTKLRLLGDIQLLDEATWSDLRLLHADERQLVLAERIIGSVDGIVKQAGPMIILEARLVGEDDVKPITTSGPNAASLLLFQVDALAEKVVAYSRLSFAENLSVADMTTKSFEAYSCYLEGVDGWEAVAVTQAQAAVERALAIDPSFALAHRLAAQIGLFLTRMTEADLHVRKAMERILTLAPVDQWRLLAIAAELRMDTRGKIGYLEKVVDVQPRNKVAHYELAEAHFHRADPTSAAPHYQRSLAIRPDYPPAINHLGYCRLFEGRTEEGILLLERYKQLTGEANAFDSLGDAHFFAGSLLEAITDKETALAKDPSLSWVHGSLAHMLFLKGCVERAFEHNARALTAEAPRDRAIAFVQRAYLKRELGMAGAEEDVESARALHSADDIHDVIEDFHAVAVLVALDGGKVQHATDLLMQARAIVDQHSVDEENYFTLFKFFLHARAEHEIASGRVEDGLKTYARLTALGVRLGYWTPPFERAFFLSRKAMAELGCGRTDAAAGTVAEGLAYNARHPDLRLAEIAVLRRQGDAAAASRLEALRSFYGSYPEADADTWPRIEAKLLALVTPGIVRGSA